jgi:hypothetical protein
LSLLQSPMMNAFLSAACKAATPQLHGTLPGLLNE